MSLVNIKPVPCQHIADYYRQLHTGHKCLAYSLLWRGYAQLAKGQIELPFNNLIEAVVK